MKKILMIIIMIMSLSIVQAADLEVGVRSDETINGDFTFEAPVVNLNIGGEAGEMHVTGEVRITGGEQHTPFIEWVKRIGRRIGYSDDSLDTITYFFVLLDSQFVSHKESKQAQMLSDIDILKGEIEYMKTLHDIDQDELDYQVCLSKSRAAGHPIIYKGIECMGWVKDE